MRFGGRDRSIAKIDLLLQTSVTYFIKALAQVKPFQAFEADNTGSANAKKTLLKPVLTTPYTSSAFPLESTTYYNDVQWPSLPLDE